MYEQVGKACRASECDDDEWLLKSQAFLWPNKAWSEPPDGPYRNNNEMKEEEKKHQCTKRFSHFIPKKGVKNLGDPQKCRMLLAYHKSNTSNGSGLFFALRTVV